MSNVWYVYILECKDGSYYTGITTDVDKRFNAHSNGKGAKYTRGRGPLSLKYVEEHDSKSSALKREYSIKKLSKIKKKELWLKK